LPLNELGEQAVALALGDVVGEVSIPGEVVRRESTLLSQAG
jgi:hypothetical protein